MTMSQLKKNIGANFFANGWMALMSFAFVPVYIRFLGMEAYGLIGFLISFQALLSLLDMGLGSAVSRELARLSVSAANAAEMRHLLRTLEVVYYAVAVVIAAIVLIVAPLLANSWLQAGYLPTQEVQQAIVIMGVAFAARWPYALYCGALMGLQQQVLLNGIRIGIETLRSAGAALVLWLVSPTLFAFLAWQFSLAVTASLLTGWITWKSLPAAGARARFQIAQLRRIWKFAAGLSGIAVTVVILTQADKVVLSKLLSLEAFGYYVLAWAVAGGLGQIISPVFSAFYPRLAQVVAKNDQVTEKALYHLGSQLMSVVLLPAGIVLAFFSREVLLLWTQNPAIAENTYLILSIVIIGTVLNGLMNIPYALQLAYGWTSLAFYANVIAIIVLVPTTILVAGAFGAVGVALIWVILNSGYVLICLQIMHRRLLPGEQRSWYGRDVALPLTMCLVVCITIRAVFPGNILMPRSLAWGVVVSLAYILSLAGAIAVLPRFRQRLGGAVGKLISSTLR